MPSITILFYNSFQLYSRTVNWLGMLADCSILNATFSVDRVFPLYYTDVLPDRCHGMICYCLGSIIQEHQLNAINRRLTRSENKGAFTLSNIDMVDIFYAKVS